MQIYGAFKIIGQDYLILLIGSLLFFYDKSLKFSLSLDVQVVVLHQSGPCQRVEFVKNACSQGCSQGCKSGPNLVQAWPILQTRYTSVRWVLRILRPRSGIPNRLGQKIKPARPSYLLGQKIKTARPSYLLGQKIKPGYRRRALGHKNTSITENL